MPKRFRNFPSVIFFPALSAFLALVFWGTALAHAESVQIAPSSADIDLSQSLEVLEDPAGILSFDQIQSSDSDRFIRFAGGTPA